MVERLEKKKTGRFEQVERRLSAEEGAGRTSVDAAESEEAVVEPSNKRARAAQHRRLAAHSWRREQYFNDLRPKSLIFSVLYVVICPLGNL